MIAATLGITDTPTPWKGLGTRRLTHAAMAFTRPSANPAPALSVL